MLWSRLHCSRRGFPLIRSSTWPPPFQSTCKKTRRSMESIQCIMQRFTDFRERPLRCQYASSFPKAGSLSAPVPRCSAHGYRTPFPSLKFSKNRAEFAAHDVVGQRGLPSPASAGDAFEALYPTLVHSSSFLQIFPQKDEQQGANDPFALVVLNYELPLLTLFLWRKACCRICADGGANQIYDVIPSLFPHKNPITVRKQYKPDIIKGDLDSIRPEVKEFYSSLGTEILDNREDQETTDLWKCAAYAVDTLPDIKKGRMKLLVLGALGGRLDHTFANLNTLYLFKDSRIVLISNESMAFLLPKGYKHEIWIDSSVEGPYCGLLPLGRASLCTTTEGLKWDLNKTSMQFGGVISTSNMPVVDCVKVSSDADLVWTISLQLLHSRLKEVVGSSSQLSESEHNSDIEHN